MIGKYKPYYHVNATRPMKLDMQMWLEFLTNFNGVLHLPDSEKIPKKPVSFSHITQGRCNEEYWPGV